MVLNVYYRMIVNDYKWLLLVMNAYQRILIYYSRLLPMVNGCEPFDFYGTETRLPNGWWSSQAPAADVRCGISGGDGHWG